MEGRNWKVGGGRSAGDIGLAGSINGDAETFVAESESGRGSVRAITTQIGGIDQTGSARHRGVYFGEKCASGGTGKRGLETANDGKGCRSVAGRRVDDAGHIGIARGVSSHSIAEVATTAGAVIAAQIRRIYQRSGAAISGI